MVILSIEENSGVAFYEAEHRQVVSLSNTYHRFTRGRVRNNLLPGKIERACFFTSRLFPYFSSRYSRQQEFFSCSQEDAKVASLRIACTPEMRPQIQATTILRCDTELATFSVCGFIIASANFPDFDGEPTPLRRDSTRFKTFHHCRRIG